MADTTAVITIRSIADLTATAGRREGLAMRGAQALDERMEEWGNPNTMTRAEVYALVERVLMATLIEEPSKGDAVDIAGEQFRSAFRDHVLVLAGPSDA